MTALVYDCALGRELTPEEVAALPAPDPLPLDEQKARLKAEIKAQQAALFQSGWTHDFGAAGTHTLDLRSPDDKANWTLLLIKAQGMIGAGAGAMTVTLRTQANETIELTATETATAMAQFLSWGEDMLSAKWGLDEAVDAAADVEAMAAIDITAGWPA